MRPFRVVPKEPVDELFIEAVKISCKEMQPLSDEVFRDSPVEALDVGVHFGASGVRVVLRDLERDTRIGKVLRKL